MVPSLHTSLVLSKGVWCAVLSKGVGRNGIFENVTFKVPLDAMCFVFVVPDDLQVPLYFRP